MFSKILIANRGEIACRIARTCERLGVATATIHSTADADSLHVREIGESIEVGGAAPSESYLNIEAVIAAAKATGAEAVHPGFGFLSENADFARACDKAGITFIGPNAQILKRFGDKAAAKHEARKADVPVVPGSLEPSTDAKEIAKLVRKLELPVMLKAAAGGGGRGMRVLRDTKTLMEDIESAMREAQGAFGYPGLIVEQLVAKGRHIEVQIAGDGEGNVVHLYERECSLQRRHQKVIEEAPAAKLAKNLRESILDDAVRLAKAVKYRGVGTVEFIVSGREYFFLEVNPRLQVEHPVTEMVTGIDLVELQLRACAGDGLGLTQEDIAVTGHSVEARLYAEDPSQGFLPSTGKLTLVAFPSEHVRVETGVETGSEVTPYYDPMIAKLITYEATRDKALDRLDLALAETSVFGVQNNGTFLRKLISLPQTRRATFYTSLIDEKIAGWKLGHATEDAEVTAMAAYLYLRNERSGPANDPWTCWGNFTGWQMSAGGDGLDPAPSLLLKGESGAHEIRISRIRDDHSMLIGVGEEKVLLRIEPLGDNLYQVILGNKRETIRAALDGENVFLQGPFGTMRFQAMSYLQSVSAQQEKEGDILSPMMGTMLKVNVKEGDKVATGDILAVLESMKLEIRINAPFDGEVTKVACKGGEKVERSQLVAVIEPH